MKKSDTKVKDMIIVSLSAALICICSWIQVPSAVPFTLQTFGVFFVPATFGAKKGVCATLLYILLGLVGLPVFSGFQGGVGVLFGSTGGYIAGFVISAFVVGFAIEKFGRKFYVNLISGTVAAVCYYAVGTLWFAYGYGDGNITGAFSVCVLPFIVPDAIKITLAMLVAAKAEKILKKIS